MITKADLDAQMNEVKKLSSRCDEAEAKVKKLEEEKATWHQRPVGGETDEKKCLRYFGVNHPKELLKVNTNAKRFQHVPEHIRLTAKALKDSVDTARWISQLFHGEATDRSGKGEDDVIAASVKGALHHAYGRDVLAPMVKAFGSTVAGAGDEWVPTAISSSYIEEYELEKVLEQRVRNIPMPTNPFELSAKKDGTKARRATEGGAMTSANFGTEKLTFSAVKSAEYYEIPEELNEDSAVDMMPLAKSEVVMAQKRAIQAAIINGDATGAHIDADFNLAGADIAEKFWDGFRALAIANSVTVDFTGATITEAKLRELRAALGKFGSNPRELAWIPGPSLYTQMLALPGVATVDKFGPQATVLQGALAAYQGIPILNAEEMREDLNATGVYDGVTTTFAGLILVNLTRFYLGNRRAIQVKLMQDLPAYDRWLLASYRRSSFVGHTQSATEKSVGYGFNAAL